MKQARIIWVNKSNESTKNYGIANTKRTLIQSCAYFMWYAAHALTETIWVFQRYEICWHDTHHIYCPAQTKRNTPWNRQMICIFAQSHVMRFGENVCTEISHGCLLLISSVVKSFILIKSRLSLSCHILLWLRRSAKWKPHEAIESHAIITTKEQTDVWN